MTAPHEAGRVDVLAVLRVLGANVEFLSLKREANEARAAVAELIGSGLPRWIDLLESSCRADPSRLDAMLREMHAALARVQGGAA